jgi:hypothetical protein
LDFAGLGVPELRGRIDSGEIGGSNSFLAWLPVGEDSLSVQINLGETPDLPLQDYYDQNLAELFQLAFNRLIMDAGIPTDGVFYSDDFSAPSDWIVMEGDWGKVGYEQDGYSIALNVPDKIFVSKPNLAFVGDVSLSVEAKEVEGDGGGYYGVICRFQDMQNFYMLRVTSDGFYSIAKYVDDQFTFFGDENWLYDENAILRDDQVNTVRADCVGSTLSLYVNDQLLMQVTDSDLALGGYGVVVGSLPGVENAKAWFDNFTAVVP